jgi:hypothetical protein
MEGAEQELVQKAGRVDDINTISYCIAREFS